jgi:hypothetical protein
MSYALTYSRAYVGVETPLVRVETHLVVILKCCLSNNLFQRLFYARKRCGIYLK